VICHERAIETGLFMGTRDFFDVLGLNRLTAARVDFREGLGGDVTDEFNAHGQFLCL